MIATDTTSPTETRQPRRIWRSFGAVFAGMLTLAVLDKIIGPW